MRLQCLFFLLSFISITTQIKTSSCKFKPTWGKKNGSTQVTPILEDSSIKPDKKSNDKEPKAKVIILPPVKIVGFIPGDRDLSTSLGKNTFNQFLLDVVLQSSENPKDLFYTELTDLQKHAQDKVNKHLYGNIEPLKKAAQNKEILWDPQHIFTPTIEMHQKGYPILTGFHHDPLSIIERSNVFEFRNKKQHNNGFYCANIAIDPNNPTAQFRKTFFPAHWTRKQVLDCILLSMKNIQSKSTIQDNGIATEEMFSTPALYKDGLKTTKLDTSLAIGFRVFNKTGKTTIPTAYPELP